MPLEIYINNKEKEALEIVLTGELDIDSSAEFQDELTKLFTQNQGNIYVNVENLSYIDSTGLGILIGAMKKVKEKENEIILVRPQNSMIKLLNITGLDKIFKIQK